MRRHIALPHNRVVVLFRAWMRAWMRTRVWMRGAGADLISPWHFDNAAQIPHGSSVAQVLHQSLIMADEQHRQKQLRMIPSRLRHNQIGRQMFGHCRTDHALCECLGQSFFWPQSTCLKYRHSPRRYANRSRSTLSFPTTAA